MTIETLQNEARAIWGDHPMELGDITVALGVVYGDICRQARFQKEAGEIDDGALKKELGNVIFSVIRWCGDLGYSPEECVTLAEEAQKKYVNKIVQS